MARVGKNQFACLRIIAQHGRRGVFECEAVRIAKGFVDPAHQVGLVQCVDVLANEVAQFDGDRANALAVAGYVAGGRAALASITAARYDVLTATPQPSTARTATGLLRAVVTGR